jgi:hypothetical protein
VDDESAAHEELARCVLRSYPPAARVFDVANGEPRLTVVIGKDALWVMDPKTNALRGSAWLAQVTAKPAVYSSDEQYFSSSWRVPVLVVNVPGFQRLSVGCLDLPRKLPMSYGTFRFSWRCDKQRQDKVAYWATGADWLTLVEKLGLGPVLEDRNAKRVKGYPWRSATASD